MRFANSVSSVPKQPRNASAAAKGGSPSGTLTAPSNCTEKGPFSTGTLVRLRDGSCGGTVQRVREASVHVVNKRTKKHFTATPDQLRPMTEEEAEAYTARPLRNELDPQVVLRRRLEIIATWSDDTPMQRVHGRIG